MGVEANKQTLDEGDYIAERWAVRDHTSPVISWSR